MEKHIIDATVSPDPRVSAAPFVMIYLVWSNFEIGDLDFFRSPEYLTYFEHLDEAGGFYYERWGDAPVHSIAAALFLPKSQLHFFDEIGYYHLPFTHCPANVTEEMQCTCSQDESFGEQWKRSYSYLFLTLPRPHATQDDKPYV